MQIWGRFLNDRAQPKAAEFFLKGAENSRVLLRKAANQHTGLAPDYTDFDGVGVKDLSGHSNFQWDAWRVVANLAVDWSWWRRDPWQQLEADTLQCTSGREASCVRVCFVDSSFHPSIHPSHPCIHPSIPPTDVHSFPSTY